MALDPDNDLLIVQNPTTKVHFKLKVADLPTIPDGTLAGDYLIWTNSGWQTTQIIDGGEYVGVEGITAAEGDFLGFFNAFLPDIEDVSNPCNALDANGNTYASDTNSNNTIHFCTEDLDPILNVTSNITVKVQPNHYVSFMFDNGDLVVQADADGIASSDHSGNLLWVRVSYDPMGVTPDPGFDEEIRLYYIQVDGNYLVDPTCS